MAIIVPDNGVDRTRVTLIQLGVFALMRSPKGSVMSLTAAAGATAAVLWGIVMRTQQ